MALLPRQQPGSACEGCRKRKLRCDRQRPKCGTCSEVGISCVFNTEQLTRGPKRGSLRALRSQIVALEERLFNQLAPESEDQRNSEPYEKSSEKPPMVCSVSDDEDDGCSNSNSSRHSDSDGNIKMKDSRVSGSHPNSPEVVIPELMGADLDQLYFDRAHSIVPLLHNGRYFSWAKQADVAGPYRRCLQKAMWTLAMALSTQFESERKLLYIETRKMLEELDLSTNSMELVQIEQVQAWILITFYEFLRVDYRRAWISLGCALRLVQLFRLHEVDHATNDIMKADEDVILSEEKRRAFWIAYCLDHFTSVQNGLPLTLNEDMICTRLPALESEFQNEHHLPACFLSEAITRHNHISSSPLAECVIMVTLYGRALSHHHISKVEQIYGNVTENFWSRHEWINNLLTQKLESFPLTYSALTILADPMLLFAFMVMHSSVLCLYKSMEPLAEMEQSKARVFEYQARAIAAARDISHLAKAHTTVSYFKAHLFMPAAIYLSAERLKIRRKALDADLQADEQESIQLESELQSCLEALRTIQRINNLGKYYLDILEFKVQFP